MNIDSVTTEKTAQRNELPHPEISSTLTLEGARKLYKRMQKEEILKKYKFPSKPSSDGYYHINLAGRTRGRGQFKARRLEDLKDKVYAYEHGIDGSTRKRFSKCFDLMQERKLSLIKDNEKRLSAQNTVNRERQAYNRFIAGTEFEKKFIDEITAKDIEAVYHDNLRRHDLREKAALGLRSIIKKTMELALKKGWIQTNPYLSCDFVQYKDMILPDGRTEDRGYSGAEMAQIIGYLHQKQADHPDYFPAYALELQIMCGLRRGEVPPLRWSDVHDGFIDICREQITVKESADKPEEDHIVSHTKTWKDRHFPVTQEITRFLEQLRDIHRQFGYESEYLFPAGTKNGVISNNTVYNFYRRMCERLDIPIRRDRIRGPHGFRRNAITDFTNRTNGNMELASRIYGNTPDVASRNYYTGVDMDAVRGILEAPKKTE